MLAIVCSSCVATCNLGVGFDQQGNSGSSGFYGEKGIKVIIPTDLVIMNCFDRFIDGELIIY